MASQEKEIIVQLCGSENVVKYIEATGYEWQKGTEVIPPALKVFRCDGGHTLLFPAQFAIAITEKER